MSTYPGIFRLRQTFDDRRIENVAVCVENQLSGLGLGSKISPGQSVAISCGSRGIAQIKQIMKAAVDFFQSIGAEPFIVPAMGSHGGGTSEGQQQVLESYGVTEAFCGCPIRSSMETVVVCQTPEGIAVHFDRHAYEADHVLICNRVKPHTGFVGSIESGMMKMMLVGLGNHEGAKIYHRAIHDFSFDQIVCGAASQVLEKCRVAAGLAIVENSYDQIAHIEAVAADQIHDREKKLLVMAKELMPRLPFDDIDVLIIDEIGKNISGTGMDTNIVGRKHNDHIAIGDEVPRIKRIVVRALTPETHGNATGIGLAEFCTTRLIEQLDQNITQINCIAASHPTGAMLPIHFNTDRKVLEAALSTIGLVEPENARVVWIRNTLELAELECSASLLAEAQAAGNAEILTAIRDLPFDEDGNLAWGKAWKKA